MHFGHHSGTLQFGESDIAQIEQRIFCVFFLSNSVWVSVLNRVVMDYAPSLFDGKLERLLES